MLSSDGLLVDFWQSSGGLLVVFWQSSVLSSGSLLHYLLAVFCVIFFIINLVTLTLSSDNNNKEDNTEDCQKITQRLPEDYYLNDSDLVRWCCCHVLSGVIPTPRTHMVGCFVLLLLMHFKCKYSRNHYFKEFIT